MSVRVVEAYSRPRPSAVHERGIGVGYIVKIGSTTLYHMGDTDLIDELLEIGERINILVIPIGGSTVMTPEEACEVVKSLRPYISMI